MNSLLLAAAAAVLYLIAYYTYGRFLGRKIFKLTKDNICPSVHMEDGTDFVPTKKQVVFGQHFSSIAGTGPIVGPALAVIWGWLPALLWVTFGCIFMGAVHDLGTLVVSLRNQGRSVGDIAGDLISSRVKLLFLLIIFFSLLILIATFAVIIGVCFQKFPGSVLPVWLQIPIAVVLGLLVHRKNMSATILGIIAVVLMYVTIIIGAYHPLTMPSLGVLSIAPSGKEVWDVLLSPIAAWVILLLGYVYIASTLSVKTLLQPRGFINSYQLFIAMGMLAVGIVIAHPDMAAPATNFNIPGSPPVMPMLFVFVACGAISGFHSVVSSGTTSKQCACERDATFVGYGSMLIEGLLAVFVIIACAAGIAYGTGMDGTTAFSQHYSSWAAASGFGAKIGAFIKGSSNMMTSFGIPLKIGICLVSVFVVSFAATTLDSATRIQRYIVAELAHLFKMPSLARKHPATCIAVGSAFILAFSEGSGQGAFNLWPLFGAMNQLLGGLALMVVTVYLAKKGVNVLCAAIPMVLMIALTGWAMYYNLMQYAGLQPGTKPNAMLLVVSIIIIAFEVWMIIESAIVIYRTVLHSKREKITA
ncbi:carbon starvation protein A [Lentisphaerota bacterium ZTH]|nr:carbon starvation protein A [Lentisphaerota bacterium]WET06443.1 carbon starvation protein A [Lentisphaerota bacterium ZTH]